MTDNKENMRLFRLAKELLSKRLGMTEAQSHRYIQKLAMDNCVTKYEASVIVIAAISDIPTADDRLSF